MKTARPYETVNTPGRPRSGDACSMRLRLLFTHQAAELLRLTPAAVRAMERRGELPAVERAGSQGARLFDRDAVEQLARERAKRRGRAA